MQHSLGSVIQMAIEKEQEAFDFYMGLHEMVEDREAKDTLHYIAREEAQHKEFLTSCGMGHTCAAELRMDAVVDYSIVQHIEKPDIKRDMNSAEIYLIAANREWNAYHFYKDLADSYPAGEVKGLLEKMADEELKHKEKMEYLYTNTAFPQTAGG